jgi:hypothetical protein
MPKRKTEALLEASREVVLEVSTGNIKYMDVFPHQNMVKIKIY